MARTAAAQMRRTVGGKAGDMTCLQIDADILRHVEKLVKLIVVFIIIAINYFSALAKCPPIPDNPASFWHLCLV
ncbi:hypothetical protein [Fontimonas thermophila]|uniref:hypothetical protein n=1 Tax=Fontimonas thermophila TaxID=1076937 RepID=UPI00117A8974|nr:hypothetical protein [Fontimonas thermophila]